MHEELDRVRAASDGVPPARSRPRGWEYPYPRSCASNSASRASIFSSDQVVSSASGIGPAEASTS